MTSRLGALRAALSVPGDRPARFEGALASGADLVILDLEDAVALGAKEAARAQVCAFLATRSAQGPAIVVRVNPPASVDGQADLAALADAFRVGGPAIDAVLVPKAESASGLAPVRDALGDVAVMALVESARGLAGAQELAATKGVAALVLGYADLGADLGRDPSDPDLWLGVQDAVLVAARAHGVRALDGPLLDTADGERLANAADHAARLGYDGKWVIHPRQVARVVDAFTPPADRIAWAVRVLEAMSGEVGVTTVDGVMVDEAVAVAARRLLARAGVPAEGASA